VCRSVVKFARAWPKSTHRALVFAAQTQHHPMHFADLSTIQHRLRVGAPLPFNVRDADHTLLLARGRTIDSDEQLRALCRRGALVDIAELLSPRDEVRQASRADLPRLWTRGLARVADTLAAAGTDTFRAALDEATGPVQALIERDPELAIFHVLRQGANDDAAYGAQRSLQTAITGFLVAQRLGWDTEQCARLFKVALTMNLSMLELQGRLARQPTQLTPEQRQELQTHPMRSVRLLEHAGVTDEAWLTAVLCHHEQEDGSGYPAGRTDAGDLASLARRADVYTSKLAARSTREALAADVAGRQMFMQDPGHPFTAALVREFGIYPPGCYVRLASGEMGIVVQRGATITTPIVACLTSAAGVPLGKPERREIGAGSAAVAAVVGERQVRVQHPLDRLAALVTG
jgi:HD-GYP domain-containing protein (c-di-GMP phosphodiesterase class II)